jgi:hypothetical protein
VAQGFEPWEACTSHAFEACSLGHSDTPPPTRIHATPASKSEQPQPGAVRRRLAAGGEERSEQRRALGLTDSGDYLGAVVQPPVTNDVP